MKLSIIKHTEDHRGDHAADIEVAYEYIPGETVEELMHRVYNRRRVEGKEPSFSEKAHTDKVIIRIVREAGS